MAAATTSAAATLSTPVAGLGGSSLKAVKRSSSSRVHLTSAFVHNANASPNALRLKPCMSRVTCFRGDWLRTDLSVIGFGLIGWLAPSSIPAINGDSLTGLFFGSIGPELAHWPTGPALTSPFWLWMILWHLGLFITLTFGQIGFKGRADGYW
ncbi:photosystem I subunit O [Selaginella moellendorffii]|uniref:photosystem I subunit O n=1 Tax=Selaginella moellendorffii TaxID=88036 RepID=UPI000D1C4620|nr:photosystem I subunit O [Selaginella moellendorffii]|eukprot:XP_002976132.2 photosystem I subunit O [Selaginella moellendorffii]